MVESKRKRRKCAAIHRGCSGSRLSQNTCSRETVLQLQPRPQTFPEKDLRETLVKRSAVKCMITETSVKCDDFSPYRTHSEIKPFNEYRTDKNPTTLSLSSEARPGRTVKVLRFCYAFSLLFFGQARMPTVRAASLRQCSDLGAVSGQMLQRVPSINTRTIPSSIALSLALLYSSVSKT